MKKLILLTLSTLLICFSARSQVLLNAGDVYVYEFTSLPIVTPADDFGSQVVGVFSWEMSGFDIATDRVRFEAFPNSLNDLPIFSVEAEFDDEGTSFVNGWPDFQGVVCITVLSGSVTLDELTFFHQIPPSGDFAGERHTLVVVPSGPELVEHLVPCAGPARGGAWKNHGKYVSTIAKVSRRLVKEGRLTKSERAEVVRAAAQSDCGKKSKNH